MKKKMTKNKKGFLQFTEEHCMGICAAILHAVAHNLSRGVPWYLFHNS